MGLFLTILGIKSRKKKQKYIDYNIGLASMIIAGLLALLMTFRIINPKVESFTGYYRYYHRNNDPPAFPFSYEYYFEGADGIKKDYHLDIFTKKKQGIKDFEPGKEYTIYYDTLTKYMVRIEDR